jgi:hypothetical protein
MQLLLTYIETSRSTLALSPWGDSRRVPLPALHDSGERIVEIIPAAAGTH